MQGQHGMLSAYQEPSSLQHLPYLLNLLNLRQSCRRPSTFATRVGLDGGPPWATIQSHHLRTAGHWHC